MVQLPKQFRNVLFMIKPRVKKKGVSTFIATLLLMVLAVSAGVIIYAYMIGYMGYMGGFTNSPQTMGAMSIDSASLNTTAMNAYIRNVGHTTIIFDKAYVNGSNATFVADPNTLPKGEVSQVTIPQAFTAAQIYEFKIISQDNTQIKFDLKAKSVSTTLTLTVSPTAGGAVTADIPPPDKLGDLVTISPDS